ncbi:Mth938-like domain-containing protein [Paracoccus marinaquae]|uniref:Mth938-like domain-containing protein n=1 Tax=Paracoccus marinaquae TaxID=2841926 RepID=A0ABS6AMG3_9RHOB|nr:Mth938-like domain-containing protein [Paracoccus marinaquae]MBU3031376.1 Mth938-like domain-containing protein [Paracoccus marinaquae]
MAMEPTDFGGAVPVDGYGPGFFRVGGKVIHGPVLIDRRGGREWGGLDDIAALLALSGQVDVLFLGMGEEIAHPPKALVAELDAVGVMVEAMASPAAARSFNVTLSEGRRVACALLPV